MYRYFPYWPLFAVLLIASVLGAWGYLRYYAIPAYEVSASLIIKDEKKGVNDSKMTESIDAFTTSKIVENEINVIQSRTLMRQVVNKLRLYAPIFEEARFRSIPIYKNSPIKIKVKDPEKVEEHAKIYFTFDQASNRVVIDGKAYKLHKWVKTPFGELQFSVNKKQKEEPENPLYFSLVHPKKVSDQLLGKISIYASSKVSTVIELTMKDEEPKRGEDILNYLIQTYNELEVNERTGIAASTLEFVEDRIKLVESELEELENKVVQYKSTKGGVNLSEQGKSLLENVGANDQRIGEINSQLAVLDEVEAYVVSKNKTAGIVPSTLGINDPVLSDLLQKLFNSEIEYQKLRKTTAENNPILVSFADEIENIRPSILENIRNQRISLEAKRANVASTSSHYNALLQTIPQKERELLELSRQQAIKNNAYSFLLQKREEAVLSYAPTAGQSRIVDMAESSLAPVSPKPFHIYLLAIMVACASGIVFIKGKELLNSKLLFRSEIVENTDAPIVAELSVVKQQKDSVFTEPTDVSIVEQFRQLRVTMGLYGRTFTKKKVMVTSSIPGEGKSFVSSNLAYSLASSGKKVVLLDFDLRNPNTSQLFDLYGQKGIIEYAYAEIEAEEIIKATPFNNLSVVPAGADIGDHTELLLNGKLEMLFEYLESKFDYIIIDTPPVDLVSDAYLLSEFSDVTLLVMRHAYTPKSLVQRLAQNDKMKSLKNVAIIFNGVKPRGFVSGQYGYGYGYGHESKYGDKTYRARAASAKS
jgi:capsular exopolysaccharide synthesis family protein